MMSYIRKQFATTLTVLMLLLVAAVPAQAVLERVGPVDTLNGGYPAWYQDTTGLALEFCEPINQAELNGGWCLILPANLPTGAVPEVPFSNYSVEHFYWNATAGRRAGGLLVLSMEASFGNGSIPLAGDQITFGRLRITYPSVPTSGDYKVYTPFGVFNFPGMATGDRLFFTQDVGLTCGTDFSCALNTVLGPFLLPSPWPGGPEVPPIPDLLPGQDPYYDALAAKTAYPATGKKYVADPARIGPMRGGTCTVNAVANTAIPGDCVLGNAPTDPAGTPLKPVYAVADPAVPVTGIGFRDPNIFRIEVNGTLVVEEQFFTTAGRIMTATIPAKVTVDRATYMADATSNRVDVFATATHALSGRIPPAALLPPGPADLGVYPAPCATDPVTGAVTGPPTVVGLTYFQLFNDGRIPTAKWWAQMLNLKDPVSGALAVPGQVCVQDLAAVNALGQIVPAYFMGTVTDDVHINWALNMWDPTLGGGTLTVSAASSDTTATPPVLTLSGYTVIDPISLLPVPAVIGTTGTVVVAPVGAPPAKVTVISSKGGTASLNTTTGVGAPVNPSVPVAGATTLTIAEDCQPLVAPALAQPHTACPAAQVVSTSATLGGVAQTAYTVTITLAPKLGTATVSGTSILYTPKLDVSGTDLIGYTVTVGTATSPEGYATVVITPLNDFPIAVNDTGGAPNNKPVTFNVLANDTDPDGATDLAAAVIASLPAAGATLTCNGGLAATVGTVCAGGLVTFTPTVLGTFTFTYNAQDKAGATSATPATVTVTVGATEAIVVTKSQYVVAKNRWTVTGTDSVIAAQTLTIAYSAGANGGTYKVNGACTGSAAGVVVGSATVDALGNWLFDQILTSAGVLNPSNTGGNSTGFWCTPPKSITITSPLGGTATTNITLK